METITAVEFKYPKFTVEIRRGRGDVDYVSRSVDGKPQSWTNDPPDVGQTFAEYCADIAESDERSLCERNLSIRDAFQMRPSDSVSDITKCDPIEQIDAREARTCRAMWLTRVAQQRSIPKLCAKISPDEERISMLCRTGFETGAERNLEDEKEAIPDENECSRIPWMIPPQAHQDHEVHLHLQGRTT